jgi:hypothetical protein
LRVGNRGRVDRHSDFVVDLEAANGAYRTARVI